MLLQKMRIQDLSFLMQKSQDQDQVQDRIFSDFQDSESGSHFFLQDQDQDQKIPDPIITAMYWLERNFYVMTNILFQYKRS